MSALVTVRHVAMTVAAARNVEETGIDPQVDVDALLNQEATRESLLAHCLDGADADRVQGWRDYVAAVFDAAESIVRAAMRSDGPVVK